MSHAKPIRAALQDQSIFLTIRERPPEAIASRKWRQSDWVATLLERLWRSAAGGSCENSTRLRARRGSWWPCMILLTPRPRSLPTARTRLGGIPLSHDQHSRTATVCPPCVDSRLHRKGRVLLGDGALSASGRYSLIPGVLRQTSGVALDVVSRPDGWFLRPGRGQR